MRDEKIPCTKEAILQYIRQYRGVSFVELTHRVDGGKGDWEIALFGGSLVLWTGLSKPLIDLLTSLREEKAIVCVPGPSLVYMIDGEMLRLPIAKRYKAYKTPHWLPCTWSAFEHLSPKIQKMLK